MCGICGSVDYDAPPGLGLIRSMTDRLTHRGPDGNGYFRDEHAALGHTRLSIIDPAGGAQPLGTQDGRLWVTFNGEIFNYIELREQLRDRGHTFRTDSDTEVVVHAWEEWQEAAFARFNGQWALAIWDRREQRLVLSRDRVGIHPLYFHRAGRRLSFASEVKALFADQRIPRAFDPAGIDQTLTYWSTVAPRTVYQDIEQLEPGQMAFFDRSGLRMARYWEPSFPEQGREGCHDLDHNTHELRERLVDAVRLRFLRSDVPVAAYLSGGIDSSVTAALMARHTEAPLQTFSLRFEDAEYDEGAHQRQMVTQLGTEHHDVMVTATDIADTFPEVVRHAESPVLRAAPAPLFLLSKLVRDNGFKVVVTGEGADEMLGGYDIFREARVRQFWTRGPESARRARAAELLYPWMLRSPGQAPAFARSFFGRNLDPDDLALSHRPRWDSTATLKSMLSKEFQAETTGDHGADLIGRMPAGSDAWDPLSRAQWLERATLLPGYLLASQGDRMLMANSVEGRFPFLDSDVVDFADGLPGWHKLFGLQEKYLLKRAFDDLVPEAILRRPKQPYRAPDAACFFSGTAPQWFQEVTSPEAIAAGGVFDPAIVSNLFAKCARRAGRGMSNTDNMRVLAVVSTQLTHQQLIVDSGNESRCVPTSPPTVAIDLLASSDGNHHDQPHLRARQPAHRP